ncbi:MAG TPA: hypothetical protein PK395_03705 [bacterium]|nr:hypothetical protein [bacterium]
MNLTRAQFRNRLPWAIFLIIVLMSMWDVVFMRYVHYHSQNRSLGPDDYEIQIVTADDYRALSDPGQATVRLADGSVLTKGPAWDTSSFRPVRDGAEYVKVTTRGTAHFVDYVLPKVLFYIFLGLVGLIATWPRPGENRQAG